MSSIEPTAWSEFLSKSRWQGPGSKSSTLVIQVQLQILLRWHWPWNHDKHYDKDWLIVQETKTQMTSLELRPGIF